MPIKEINFSTKKHENEKTSYTHFAIFCSKYFYWKCASLYFGVNGGFLKNATIAENNTSSRPSWNKERLNSFNGGVNLGYNLSKHWSLGTQLQFVNLRYYERLDFLYHPRNIPGGWLIVKIDWYNSHHYIRIPVLVHYHFFSNQSKFDISLFAGPYFGFQTKQTTKFIEANELGQQYTNSMNDEEIPLKKFDL